MATKQSVIIGQRYRDVQPNVFGRSALEWIVEAVRIGVDGIEHARLVCAADHTERKTLSAAVLADRRRFIRVDG